MNVGVDMHMVSWSITAVVEGEVILSLSMSKAI